LGGRDGGIPAPAAAVGLLLAVAATGAAQADCATGPAVADPHNNPGLLADCAALLAAGERWTGDGGLNWSPQLELSEWDGVTVDAAGMRVTHVSLPWKRLEGAIPGELGRLSELERLDLAHNRLSGGIPAALAALADLELLDLSHNDLSGAIPGELGHLADLETLDLAGNGLTGSIPRELGNLADLEVLDLRYSELSGFIPGELGALADLQTLSLSGNKLSGNIPGDLGYMAELESLDLSYNRLSGPIPPSLGNLSDLERLDLAGNVLSGPIPERLAGLASLEALDLSANKLEGTIPPVMGRALPRLEVMNLSGNDLHGDVPAALRARVDLVLDLSGNPSLAAMGGPAAEVRVGESAPPDIRPLEWVGASHRIRIDRVGGSPRYASWRAEASPGDDPDLLLGDGRAIQEVGGRAALYYLFTTGAYRYVILDKGDDAQEPHAGCLFVYRDRARIRAEPIRRVRSGTAAEAPAGSCDVDIGAKIERWLAESE
jgi:uncharacterized protein YjbI with pentapeptide repeats